MSDDDTLDGGRAPTYEPSRGRRRNAGGTLSRSATVTVRLDERLRFLAELAARQQRRTLSSFVEYAIEQALKQEKIGYDQAYEEDVYLSDLEFTVWDVEEADRLVRLAERYERLLTFDEQKLWKLIRELPGLWIGFDGRPEDFEWKLRYKCRFGDLRLYFEDLKRVAAGDLPRDKLPAFLRTGVTVQTQDGNLHSSNSPTKPVSKAEPEGDLPF